MIKVYFDDGDKKKVNADTFVEWVIDRNLVIDENDIYYKGLHIAKYVNLLDNNFGVIDCILCLILVILIILVLMKGGVIL
nr:MAG TPA: hypothetical protein [Caudoviricetes sp.]